MTRPPRLRVNEIFHSVQGEGTRAGLRCVFIRLTGCHLRCAWCDTAYAFYEGCWLTLDQILERVRASACPTVAVTGGEPLLQPAVYLLLQRLADEFATVLLETSGALSIARVDPRVVRSVDIKCPSSGEAERNDWDNIALLRPTDEVKFVIGTRADYEYARDVVRRYGLPARCPVLFSPVALPPQATAALRTAAAAPAAGAWALAPAELAGWILGDRLDVRLNLQLHKVIWPDRSRGV